MDRSTRRQLRLCALLCITAVCGCSDNPPAVEKSYGPKPDLPAPNESFFPTMNIAPATGWQHGTRPEAAPGFAVNAYATGLNHPRWLYALPNGDILVAETNAPERPEEHKGLRGWVMKKTMRRAGAGVPSADRIALLRDTDGDGVADFRSTFLEGLRSPFGMYLDGKDFYVANTDALVHFHYETGANAITTPAQRVAELPGGPLNHHWTKNVIGDPGGDILYVTVGSNSNIAENGMDKEHNRAAILSVDPQSGQVEVFASGLRNPNGLAWQPQTGKLWTTVNERDELGDNLVPDYMTEVRAGAFYGWPYSYFGQHVDERVQPQRPDLVAAAEVPDYALGAHTGSLGLDFYTADLFPERFRNGAFVGQHGSWNRNELSGYKVIFVPFENGRPSGLAEDILTGFIASDGKASGRPVGVTTDGAGALLVADDVGNVVWRVVPEAGAGEAGRE